MTQAERRRRVLRVYVSAVAGLAALGVSAVFLAAGGRAEGTDAAFAVVVGLGAVSFWFPLMRTGSAGARTYHLVEMPFTAAILLLDPRRAVVAFAVGIAAGWLMSGRSPMKIVFGIAEHATAGSVGVLVSHAVGGRASVPAAVVAYFAVNEVLNCSVFQLAGLRRKGEPFFVDLAPSVAATAVAALAGAFVGLVGSAGSGAVLLATVPIGLVLALSRVCANRTRAVEVLQGIVAAVADTHAGMSSEEVEKAVCDRVVQVLDCPHAAMRDEPPGEGELGAPVQGEWGTRWLVAQARPVEGFRTEEADLLRAMAGVAQRAMENASLQEQLARQAQHDPLTGLPNRRLVTASLDAALARARRSGVRVGVAFLDLTEFKAVNDAMGHDAGDALLCRVADRLAASVRAGDMVGRFGGDEFVLLLPDMDDVAARSLGTRLLDVFALPFDGVEVHCNIGLATWPADGDDAASLLRQADSAMYEAKRRGGNTIAYASGLLEELGASPA